MVRVGRPEGYRRAATGAAPPHGQLCKGCARASRCRSPARCVGDAQPWLVPLLQGTSLPSCRTTRATRTSRSSRRSTTAPRTESASANSRPSSLTRTQGPLTRSPRVRCAAPLEAPPALCVALRDESRGETHSCSRHRGSSEAGSCA
eukprot:scaffold3419_cov251-Prasinococcus_capsulatus_cf.AAC.3